MREEACLGIAGLASRTAERDRKNPRMREEACLG
jgi:hypothetical protein